MRTFPFSAVALSLALTGLLTVGAGTASAVNCCSLNGSTCSLIPPLVHGSQFWTTPFCGATVSGTNCTVELDADQNVASGDCITVGAGVTLDLKGHSIICTGTACGSAVINNASSGSASKVDITDTVSTGAGTSGIKGCWARGVNVSGGTNSTVTSLMIDLATQATGGAACTNALPAGIFQPRGTIHRARVFNALSGIYLYPGEDVTDSLLGGNYVGIDNVGASSASVNLTNVQWLNNGYAVKNANPGTYMPDVRGSSIQGDAADPCHCLNASNTCVSNLDSCLNFGTSTNSPNTSFVNDELHP